MKHRENSSKRKLVKFPVWTQEQAERAIPYIGSVVRSIREQFVQLRLTQARVRRLAGKTGRPDRQSIIDHEEGKREAARLEGELADSTAELLKLNVHCVDAAAGIAMIPFLKDHQLAWFVFELFADRPGLTAWRYNEDEISARRPLDETAPKITPTTHLA